SLSLTGEHLGRWWSGSGSTSKWSLSPSDEITAALPVAVTGKATSTLVLTSKVAAKKFEITCSGLTLNKATLEAAGKSSGKASFSGCQVKLEGKVSAACEPRVGAEKGAMATEALKGQLVLSESETLEQVSPVTGKVLAVALTGEECALGEVIPVLGTLD